MDILGTAWLPCDIGVATPVQLLQQGRAIRWHRGDWEAATLCLLHAMVQTAVVLEPARCPNRAAWARLLAAPPANLAQWLEFDLGKHPWECPGANGLVPVASLLPETPGENTLKKTADIARWQQDVPLALTLAEATIAVISDNLWGTRIGTGHRQGARGEQALTTLVEPVHQHASVWERVWLNVLPADTWNARFQNPAAFAFPWRQPLPSRALTPAESHSLAILWQMPRRWRIVQDDDGLVRQVHRENKGRNYEGWEGRHPLTPYFVKSDGTWTARKVGPHTGFKDWAAIALARNPKTQPAITVSEFIENAWNEEPLRLRCCGWALGDTGAAGGWIDHVVPFYVKGAAQADDIERAIGDAEGQRQQLWKALNEVQERLGRHSDRLYPHMEAGFFRRVGRDDWDAWKDELRAGARAVFWVIAEDHGADVFRASRAARYL